MPEFLVPLIGAVLVMSGMLCGVLGVQSGSEEEIEKSKLLLACPILVILGSLVLALEIVMRKLNLHSLLS